MNLTPRRWNDLNGRFFVWGGVRSRLHKISLLVFTLFAAFGCDDAPETTVMNIHIGDQVLQGEESLFELTDSERQENNLKIDFLRMARLLQPDEIVFPDLPEGRREATIAEHGALTFRQIPQGSPISDTSARLAKALSAGEATPGADDVAGFDAYLIDDLQGSATAYRAKQPASFILETPFTVICDTSSDNQPRICTISMALGPSTLAKYTFYDDVWATQHWSVLAQTLDHTFKALLAPPPP